MSRELLTEDKQHLKLFDDGISINKSLPKWKRAEEGLKETEVPENEKNDINNYFIIQEGTSTMGFSVNNNDNDVDRNIDSGRRWLPLYQTPEGLSFDEIASAGIKDMTRLIAEKKIKYIMAGYGSFGSTAYASNYLSQFESNGSVDKEKEKLASSISIIKKAIESINE